MAFRKKTSTRKKYNKKSKELTSDNSKKELKEEVDIVKESMIKDLVEPEVPVEKPYIVPAPIIVEDKAESPVEEKAIPAIKGPLARCQEQLDKIERKHYPNWRLDRETDASLWQIWSSLTQEYTGLRANASPGTEKRKAIVKEMMNELRLIIKTLGYKI